MTPVHDKRVAPVVEDWLQFRPPVGNANLPTVLEDQAGANGLERGHIAVELVIDLATPPPVTAA